MAERRALVVVAVIAVVLIGVSIGVLGLATNDTDESVQDELTVDPYAGARSLSGSEDPVIDIVYFMTNTLDDPLDYAATAPVPAGCAHVDDATAAGTIPGRDEVRNRVRLVLRISPLSCPSPGPGDRVRLDIDIRGSGDRHDVVSVLNNRRIRTDAIIRCSDVWLRCNLDIGTDYDIVLY